MDETWKTNSICFASKFLPRNVFWAIICLYRSLESINSLLIFVCKTLWISVLKKNTDYNDILRNLMNLIWWTLFKYKNSIIKWINNYYKIKYFIIPQITYFDSWCDLASSQVLISHKLRGSRVAIRTKNLFYYWFIKNIQTWQPEAELRLKLQSIRKYIYTITYIKLQKNIRI